MPRKPRGDSVIMSGSVCSYYLGKFKGIKVIFYLIVCNLGSMYIRHDIYYGN
jgi:hypothetical protein